MPNFCASKNSLAFAFWRKNKADAKAKVNSDSPDRVKKPAALDDAQKELDSAIANKNLAYQQLVAAKQGVDSVKSNLAKSQSTSDEPGSGSRSVTNDDPAEKSMKSTLVNQETTPSVRDDAKQIAKSVSLNESTGREQRTTGRSQTDGS